MVTQSKKKTGALLKVVNGTIILIIIFILSVKLILCSGINNRLKSMSGMFFTANLRRLNAALIQYTEGHSGEFPNSKNWFNALVNSQPLIINTDYEGMSSSLRVAVFYNNYLSGRSISNLKGNTVVLFEGKGEANASGNKEVFYGFSSERPIAKLVTLDGSVYVYYSESKKIKRLGDSLQINPDDLFWGEE